MCTLRITLSLKPSLPNMKRVRYFSQEISRYSINLTFTLFMKPMRWVPPKAGSCLFGVPLRYGLYRKELTSQILDSKN
nr:unnamed protein product [Spirometra erinaceieuropaei]